MSKVIRYINLISYLLCCLAADAQQQVMIIKRCNFEGNNHFSSENYICEKMYFNGEEPTARLTYAINNWQVYDSAVFEHKGNERCIVEFHPEYNFDSRIITRYKFARRVCGQEDTLNPLLWAIHDRYDLSKPYLKDLSFLLESDPDRKGDTFSFRDGIIPLFFVSYGIPYNELLYSFSFRISDNTIRSDTFYLQYYTLTRSFKYEDGILQKVEIAVEDKRDNSISKWQEYFSKVNL
ncbi:hypothetical protein [Polluticoccus soli]|uniref:hypothetical protein n=1 Tax=Polluticoccus soli TaxID=3034150 RepID=UPI0023E21177|nr:hypothetical protein [Flavipsychrobacter sp. JY13-12]